MSLSDHLNNQEILFLHRIFNNFLNNTPTPISREDLEQISMIRNKSEQILSSRQTNALPNNTNLISTLIDLESRIQHQLNYKRNYLMFTPDSQTDHHKSEIAQTIRLFYKQLQDWIHRHYFSSMHPENFKSFCSNHSLKSLLDKANSVKFD